MVADLSGLHFELEGERGSDELAAWLAGEAWPFHARSKWSVGDALRSSVSYAILRDDWPAS